MWEWYFIIFGVIGAWAASDARDRGKDKWNQLRVFIGILLLGIIGLIIWFATRPKKGSKRRKDTKTSNESKMINIIGAVSLIFVLFVLIPFVLGPIWTSPENQRIGVYTTTTACSPNWHCGNWSSCRNYSKTGSEYFLRFRFCLDLNKCPNTVEPVIMGITGITFDDICKENDPNEFCQGIKENHGKVIFESCIPIKTVADIPNYPKYNEEIDCSVEANYNVTYVSIKIDKMVDKMDVAYPNYRWYPSLNEGKINNVHYSGYNGGCTKIKMPALLDLYVVKGKDIIYYNGGDSFETLGEEYYAFPDEMVASPSFSVGGINIVVKEGGEYKIYIIIIDSETNKVIGGDEAEFEM